MQRQTIGRHGLRYIANDVYRLKKEISLTAKNGEEDSTKETELMETFFYDSCHLIIKHDMDYSYSKELQIIVYTSADGIILNSAPYKDFTIETKEVFTVLIPPECNYIQVKFQNKDPENSTKFIYVLVGIVKYR